MWWSISWIIHDLRVISLTWNVLLCMMEPKLLLVGMIDREGQEPVDPHRYPGGESDERTANSEGQSKAPGTCRTMDDRCRFPGTLLPSGHGVRLARCRAWHSRVRARTRRCE